MAMSDITVRKAVVADAPFLGLVVAMALGGNESHPYYNIFVELAARSDSQYSYCNALVVQVDGVVAGAIVGYDGARLQELRRPLYELMRRHLGEVRVVEDETSAGEFYADSLAVLPQYRGMGVGRLLLGTMRDNAFALGFDRVGLLVDFDNPRAEKLYSSLGFSRVNRTTFLGHDMWHLQVQKK